MITRNGATSIFLFYMIAGNAALASVTPASAADIIVIRGNKSEVVSTDPGADGSVTVISGLSRSRQPHQVQQETSPAREDPLPAPSGGAIVTGGDTLWNVDAGGRVRACWLQGTGYVNSLKVVCTR
ncbi:MAG: hypothetical protein IPM60_15955 [Rhodospirillales bacterium]|nr:hypothetical protein [Rhodospirillales bacterium]